MLDIELLYCKARDKDEPITVVRAEVLTLLLAYVAEEAPELLSPALFESLNKISKGVN